ncbi:hypothetical protein SJI19_03415 [Acerihabitans sp. TG2]|uniref:hypothetical protein n=1 Tax=Acerihabitans sp. TG2 TaxID=3096008 RepID=UPI002B228F0A|nr:hypothetical protein [Acerihabitans sp. TG2]MEA9389611.1 hypothetical protein [Acerihabitans sp. TG2]
MKKLNIVVAGMALALLCANSMAATHPVDDQAMVIGAAAVGNPSLVWVNSHWEKLSIDHSHRYPMTSVSGQTDIRSTSAVYE